MPSGLFLFLLLLTLGAAAEEVCPPTEVIKFAELYANPHLHPCQKVSAGFSMAPPIGYPTDLQIEAMCGSDACRALIDDVFALEPADCFLSFAGLKLNAYKMATSVQDACDNKNSHEDDTLASIGKSVNTSISKVTESDEQDSTPKSTKHNDQNSTLGEKIKFKLDEPMVIKNELENQHCPTQISKNETAKEAGILMPPMNGTALEMFPTPDTTYKATVPPTV